MKFKHYTVRLDDSETGSRLDALISSIPDCHTAFDIEIKCHESVGKKTLVTKNHLVMRVSTS